MSPSDEEQFHSFLVPKKTTMKKEKAVKQEPKRNEGQEVEGKPPAPESGLEKIMKRLRELEAREKDRQEEAEAKKRASAIFNRWDQDLGPGLKLEDLQDNELPGVMRHVPTEVGFPTHKQMRLSINKFSGKETYKGLGCGFMEWGHRFLRAINMAQRLSGLVWPEDICIDVLSQYLDGRALSYFNAQYLNWWSQQPTLVFALDGMFRAFSAQLTLKQAVTLFEQPKDPSRNFHQHYAYLVEVNAAAGGQFANLVLDSVLHHSYPELTSAMLGRYDVDRQDYLRQAEELCTFAQRIVSMKQPARNLGKELKGVNLVDTATGETVVGMLQDKKPNNKNSRNCFNCGKIGHIAKNCRQKKKSGHSNDGGFMLAVDDQEIQSQSDQIVWILDSGCARNLTGMESLLMNTRETETLLTLPDGTKMKSTKIGSVKMQTLVDGKMVQLTITNVEYVPGLKKNLLSYGIIESKGVVLSYIGSNRYLVNGKSQKLAAVQKSGQLLVVKVFQ